MILILETCASVEKVLKEIQLNTRHCSYDLPPAVRHPRPRECSGWSANWEGCAWLWLFTYFLEHFDFYAEHQWFCASPEFTEDTFFSAEGTPFLLRMTTHRHTHLLPGSDHSPIQGWAGSAQSIPSPGIQALLLQKPWTTASQLMSESQSLLKHLKSYRRISPPVDLEHQYMLEHVITLPSAAQTRLPFHLIFFEHVRNRKVPLKFSVDFQCRV